MYQMRMMCFTVDRLISPRTLPFLFGRIGAHVHAGTDVMEGKLEPPVSFEYEKRRRSAFVGAVNHPGQVSKELQGRSLNPHWNVPTRLVPLYVIYFFHGLQSAWQGIRGGILFGVGFVQILGIEIHGNIFSASGDNQHVAQVGEESL